MTTAVVLGWKVRKLEERKFVQDLDDPAGSQWNRLIDEDRVSEDARFAAHAALVLCSADLGLAPPRLRWFRSVSEREKQALKDRTGNGTWWRTKGAHQGWAHRSWPLILVRSDLSIADLSETVAHEVAHVSETKSRGPEHNERRATHYGKAYVSWMRGGGKFRHHDGFPYAYHTLAGEVDPGGLLVADTPRGDGLALYRNCGSRQSPEWRRTGVSGFLG